MNYRNVVFSEDGKSFEGEQEYMAGHWCGVRARLDLHTIHLACDNPDAIERIWDRQDGYGAPGAGPDWDWSGIRDSSEEAIADMYAIALEYVTAADLAARLGVPEEVIRL